LAIAVWIANIDKLFDRSFSPLVKLNRLVLPGSATVFLKVESNTPGGSVKDRIGLAII
jgi:cysteine synthase